MFLNTCKQLLVVDENIRIRDRLKDFWTPHVIRSTMMTFLPIGVSIAKLQPLLRLWDTH